MRFTRDSDREEEGWMSDTSQEITPRDTDSEEDLIYNISSDSDTGSIISEGYHTEDSQSSDSEWPRFD